MKGLPKNEEAERAAIGCMVLDGYRVVHLAQNVKGMPPEAWYVPAHAAAVRVLYEMTAAGRPVDLVTVHDKLARAGGAAEGFSLEACIDAAVTAQNAEYYLDIVRNCWIRRGVIEKCTELQARALTEEDGVRLLAGAPDELLSVAGAERKTQSNAEVMEATIAEWEKAQTTHEPAVGLTVPWEKLTKMMCGLEPGLTIVAGRPSAGKTTLEDMLAMWVADAGVPVLRVTLDSTRKELLSRAMCRGAEISLPRLKFGYTGGSHLARVREHAKRIGAAPMHIEEELTDIAEVCTAARMYMARHRIGLITLDYLQQLEARELGREAANTVARVTHISRRLKQLSLALKIPVVVLSQLSRAVEKEGREPQLSDLRDSGAIEQDAEKVLMLEKHEKKCREMEAPDKGGTPGATKHKRPVMLHVLKHKNGQTGKMAMWLYPPYFKFVPAQEGFADDAMPSDRGHEEREWERDEVWLPQDEGTPAPAATKAGRQTAAERAFEGFPL